MKHITVLLFFSIFILFSCNDNKLNNNGYTESILLDLIDNDDAVGIDGFDSDGDMDLDHEFGLETEGLARIFNDTLSFGEGYRIRFGRTISNRERNIEFEVGQDTAVGLVSYDIDGQFIVSAIDTNQNQIDSLSFIKDFSNILNRKIRFIKIDDQSNGDGYRWKIDALTPMVGGAGDKLVINELAFYALDDSLQVGELLYSFTLDEIGDLFIDRESLPTFTAFSKIISYVNIDNEGPEYTMDSTNVGEWVFLNYGKNRLQRGRKHLHDSGIGFDQIMNDNIHSGVMRVHGPGPGQVRGIFRTFIESIDLSTIFVSNGGYNTIVWSIPYRVERP